MHQKIRSYLSEIEKKNDITILLACETGSRAWGFPSPDSDFDIRLIYAHPKDWYLSLNEEKDTLELMLEDNNLDISGWDLRKTLRLLWKSNPPLLERIQSPIVYMHNESFLSGIRQLAQPCYSRIATIFHYSSMGKKCLEEIVGKDQYKLKTFFYALRAASACRWILERDEMPPIHFPIMYAGISMHASLRKRIEELIALKANQNESYLHRGENDLIAFIEESLRVAETQSKKLPSSHGNFDLLNSFFRSQIR